MKEHLFVILFLSCLLMGCLGGRVKIQTPISNVISLVDAVRLIYKAEELIDQKEYIKALNKYSKSIPILNKATMKGFKCLYPFNIMDKPIYLPCRIFLNKALHGQRKVMELRSTRQPCCRNQVLRRFSLRKGGAQWQF